MEFYAVNSNARRSSAGHVAAWCHHLSRIVIHGPTGVPWVSLARTQSPGGSDATPFMQTPNTLVLFRKMRRASFIVGDFGLQLTRWKPYSSKFLLDRSPGSQSGFKRDAIPRRGLCPVDLLSTVRIRCLRDGLRRAAAAVKCSRPPPSCPVVRLISTIYWITRRCKSFDTNSMRLLSKSIV